ncbi:hypothetical protein EV664_102411 [Stakelama pacifica]|uniref:YlxR domain-containing protein n=1 Tax=Stakelama pacifica TaxID=517720 RepID=A0A4R6FV35_9SPHN|nr:hypothetical protein EV664_102411 [Stakelama pacifica]GGO91882.1 hypothetical protein GCM10011329_07610 [Stakelama pacifica]
MRTPNNDTALSTDTLRHAGLVPASTDACAPIRTCILSREESPREGLIRLAISPDGDVLPDVRAKAPGRGAWIGVTRAELEEAQAKGKLRGALARAFKGAKLSVPDDLGERIAAALERNALDRLGLESRAGRLIIGSERIEKAARSGKLCMLLHANDARADGAAKLAQAWRVGSESEGSGLKGLALPVGRTILSLALGRENVVHAGLTDAQAAKRVREALDRWLHFIGPECFTLSCESESQGASAFEPAGVEKTKDFE